MTAPTIAEEKLLEEVKQATFKFKHFKMMDFLK